MDATRSMSDLIEKTKITISKTFERSMEILQKGGLTNCDCFQVQFAVFINYSNNSEEILQYSLWEHKANNLKSFMNKITVLGGLESEAVEIGLWHANNESKSADGVSQIILIGDAPSNSKEDVLKHREDHTEKYWLKSKFGIPTDYRAEIEKLKQKNIKINCFF